MQILKAQNIHNLWNYKNMDKHSRVEVRSEEGKMEERGEGKVLNFILNAFLNKQMV